MNFLYFKIIKTLTIKKKIIKLKKIKKNHFKTKIKDQNLLIELINKKIKKKTSCNFILNLVNYILFYKISKFIISKQLKLLLYINYNIVTLIKKKIKKKIIFLNK